MGGRAPEPTKTASVPVPLTAVVLLLFVSAALRFRGVFLDPTFWGEDGTFATGESSNGKLPKLSCRTAGT